MTWTVLNNGALSDLNDSNYETVLGTPFPKFFMSGDGHRNPPFQWVSHCPALKIRLQEQLLAHTLWVHVEQQPGEVTESSLPSSLALAFPNGRVFGWELSLYQKLNKVMQDCLQMAPEAIHQNEAVGLTGEMLEVQAIVSQFANPANMTGLLPQIERFHDHYVTNAGGRDATTDAAYSQFLMQYNNAAMQLRTDANPEIGRNIQSKIDQNPGSIHLITCGDAHLTVNPLYNYVQLPPGTRGVVDCSHG